MLRGYMREQHTPIQAGSFDGKTLFLDDDAPAEASLS
jgi:hypothetical protein